MSAAESNQYPVRQDQTAGELHDALSPSRRAEDDQPSPEQLAIYRRMKPGRRLELAEQLYWSGRELKAAWLRTQHPVWTEEQVSKEVTRIFSHARS